MRASTRTVVITVAVVGLLVGAGVYAYTSGLGGAPQATTSTVPAKCAPLAGRSLVRSQLNSTSFDAMTEYALPTPGRGVNAITTAPDGSVWFGEQNVPGVAHFYPSNGTLVEYAWPWSFPLPQGDCSYKTSIWGVALWNGSVWAAEGDHNQLIGLDPATGATTVVNITKAAVAEGIKGVSFPYTLTVGPDGALWFTLISSPATIGKLAQDGKVTLYRAAAYAGAEVTQIEFVNSTYAYYVELNSALPGGPGRLLAFNPQTTSTTMTPMLVGGNVTLISPNSLAVAGSSIFVTQHLASNIVGYNTTSGLWTTYPTSTVPYIYTTLPYFVAANGTTVWFNEHYSNKIAAFDTKKGTLTEYSESNPPIENESNVQNDLTIALTRQGLWFTSYSGGYIGFVNASYAPPFAISVAGSNQVTIPQGGSADVSLAVTGEWQGSLSTQVSDSENSSAIPSLLSIEVSPTSVQAGAGAVQAKISAAPSIQPGRYVVSVTVTQGGVSQSAYVYVTVTG